jgi:hypothetical protein
LSRTCFTCTSTYEACPGPASLVHLPMRLVQDLLHLHTYLWSQTRAWLIFISICTTGCTHLPLRPVQDPLPLHTPLWSQTRRSFRIIYIWYLCTVQWLLHMHTFLWGLTRVCFLNTYLWHPYLAHLPMRPVQDLRFLFSILATTTASPARQLARKISPVLDGIISWSSYKVLYSQSTDVNNENFIVLYSIIL